MNFTWNVKLFREQELEIQVLFGDPLGISVSSVRYQKFLKGLGMWFVGSDGTWQW